MNYAMFRENVCGDNGDLLFRENCIYKVLREESKFYCIAPDEDSTLTERMPKRDEGSVFALI